MYHLADSLDFVLLLRLSVTFHRAPCTHISLHATAVNRRWKFRGIRRHGRRAPAANILARLGVVRSLAAFRKGGKAWD